MTDEGQRMGQGSSDARAREERRRNRDARGAQRRPESSEVARARHELAAARRSLGHELDSAVSETRSALDIPAKIREEPVKTAALAGGGAFLLLGGPRRVLRAAQQRIAPQRRGKHEGLLPAEIDRILKRTGAARDPEVRDAVANDFADYLRRQSKTKADVGALSSFWRTYDSLVGPIGAVAAKVLIDRLFASRGVQRTEQLDRKLDQTEASVGRPDAAAGRQERRRAREGPPRR